MATKAPSKKAPRIVRSWKPKTLRIIVIIGIAALILQVIFDFAMYERVVSTPSGEPITSMIVEAVNAQHKPAVIDPVSKKVYLPDANLVLPPQSQTMPNLLYSYAPSSDNADSEAGITVTNAISVGVSKLRNAEGQGLLNRNSNKVFDAVPDLQVCSRGIHVVFGTKTTYDHLQFSKSLADGRTMYAYTEAKSCAYDLQPLVEYLRGAQSY
ncbi:MAG TPA: hypothetical protein VLF59_01525 [Candidatus Saccharimonadales bacterium]|nr:hypothetical protein [Candidatus Saccharimonadales bacterium]